MNSVSLINLTSLYSRSSLKSGDATSSENASGQTAEQQQAKQAALDAISAAPEGALLLSNVAASSTVTASSDVTGMSMDELLAIVMSGAVAQSAADARKLGEQLNATNVTIGELSSLGSQFKQLSAGLSEGASIQISSVVIGKLTSDGISVPNAQVDPASGAVTLTKAQLDALAGSVDSQIGWLDSNSNEAQLQLKTVTDTQNELYETLAKFLETVTTADRNSVQGSNSA